MRIPKADKAVVEMRKLTDYCLDLSSEVGGHKARVFASALGLRKEDAFKLSALLKIAVRENEAELGRADEFGQRYIVDFEAMNGDKNAMVRSVWISEADGKPPRLVTCFVL
ncbi:MAG: hypothetical protein KF831_12180 [Acidobacteria bacterium]|nr:hypothetical protein [Acidobacteriota bacterium]